MRSRWLLTLAACGTLFGAALTASAAEPGAAPPGPGPMALERIRGMIEKMRAEGKTDAEVLQAVTQALERLRARAGGGPAAAPGRGAAGGPRAAGRGAWRPGLGRGFGPGAGLGVGGGFGRGAAVGRGAALGRGLRAWCPCPACPFAQKARAQAAAKVRAAIEKAKPAKKVKAPALEEKPKAKPVKKAKGERSKV